MTRSHAIDPTTSNALRFHLSILTCAHAARCAPQNKNKNPQSKKGKKSHPHNPSQPFLPFVPQSPLSKTIGGLNSHFSLKTWSARLFWAIFITLIMRNHPDFLLTYAVKLNPVFFPLIIHPVALTLICPRNLQPADKHSSNSKKKGFFGRKKYSLYFL